MIMSKPLPEKRPFLFLLGWFVIGALIAVAVTLLDRSIHDLPVDASRLWLPVVFGGLAGTLFGRSDVRLHGMNRRLENSEKRFRQFYQRTPAMLHSMDSEGRLIYVSQSWLDTLGYQREEVIGRSFFDFIADANVQEIKAKHFQSLRTFGEIRDNNYQLRLANGSALEVSISEVAQRDSGGRLRRRSRKRKGGRERFPEDDGRRGEGPARPG